MMGQNVEGGVHRILNARKTMSGSFVKLTFLPSTSLCLHPWDKLKYEVPAEPHFALSKSLRCVPHCTVFKP